MGTLRVRQYMNEKEKDNSFSLSFVLPPKGEGYRALTAAETEAWLKKELQERGGADVHILTQMLTFYSSVNNFQKALSIGGRLLDLTDDVEQEAAILLRMGVAGERVEEYAFAAGCYKEALELDISDIETKYWLLNNLGYCLNKLERYSEAGRYLEQAIVLSPARCNAYKNLGLCYQGLGRLVEAVEQFLRATHLNAADERSMNHLASLVSDNPELFVLVPELEDKINTCIDAVAHAKSMMPDYAKYWQSLRKERSEEEEDQT